MTLLFRDDFLNLPIFSLVFNLLLSNYKAIVLNWAMVLFHLCGIYPNIRLCLENINLFENLLENINQKFP